MRALPATEHRRLAAIMFTDMVGSSALSRRNEARAVPWMLTVLLAATLRMVLFEARWEPFFSIMRTADLLPR